MVAGNVGNDDGEDQNTRELVIAQNKKQKKSGGFQSMGKLVLLYLTVIFLVKHI